MIPHNSSARDSEQKEISPYLAAASSSNGAAKEGKLVAGTGALEFRLFAVAVATASVTFASAERALDLGTRFPSPSRAAVGRGIAQVGVVLFRESSYS